MRPLKSIVFTYFMCLCIRMCVCPSMRSGWWVVSTLRESMFSLYHVNPRIRCTGLMDAYTQFTFSLFYPVLDPGSQTCAPYITVGPSQLNQLDNHFQTGEEACLFSDPKPCQLADGANHQGNHAQSETLKIS